MTKRDAALITKVEAARQGQKWSGPEVALLLRLAQSHLPGLEIAKRLERSYAGVQEKAWSLGERIGRPRTPRRAWENKDSDQLIKLAAAGIMRRTAAEMMHRDVGTLRSHAEALGLNWVEPPRPPGAPKITKRMGPVQRPWTAEDDRALAQLADGGLPVGLAANQMDRSYNTVRKHAMRLGLKFERDRLARIRHRPT